MFVFMTNGWIEDSQSQAISLDVYQNSYEEIDYSEVLDPEIDYLEDLFIEE